MSESKTQSMDFAVSIIHLAKELKAKKESIISNQIGRSGTPSELCMISHQSPQASASASNRSSASSSTVFTI